MPRRAGERVPGKVLFLFLDGVGIGAPDPGRNPFAAFPTPGFEALIGGPMPFAGSPPEPSPGTSVSAIDATLGVPGLPQSGTGQAAILTGENAPALLGRHFGPFPHSSQRDLLTSRSLFRRLAESGRSVAYLNAFPARYTEHVALHPGRTGAFSFAWRSAGGTLNGATALAAGEAISADITSEGWGALGHPEVPAVSPREAAGVALSALRRHEFVLYEYYFTDHAGHGRARRDPETVLRTLDAFIGAIAGGLDRESESVVLTSDHGNFEDLSTRRHTMNPVPFIAAGAGHRALSGSVRDLTGIAPALLDYLAG